MAPDHSHIILYVRMQNYQRLSSLCSLTTGSVFV